MNILLDSESKHTLSKPMIAALEALNNCGESSIAELPVPNRDRIYFYRLWFWDLIKLKDNGKWAVTESGGAFLNGEIALPKHAIVKKNWVVGLDGPLITRDDI